MTAMRHSRPILGACAAAILALGVALPAQTSKPASRPAKPTSRPAKPAAGKSADAPAAAPSVMAGDADTFAHAVEMGSGMDAWMEKTAFAADVTITFGGQTFFSGTMTVKRDFSGARLEAADGTVAVWDGKDAWVTPSVEALPRARFHLLTWPYFVAVPFKLMDPGAKREDTGPMMWMGSELPTMRLTFEKGTGDAPDDWYLCYADPVTNRLVGMGYIVTYPGMGDPGEPEPHAIKYDGWTTVDGVEIPTKWEFYMWNEAEGATGEPIGHAELTDFRFAEPRAGAFAKPEGAAADPLPGQ